MTVVVVGSEAATLIEGRDDDPYTVLNVSGETAYYGSSGAVTTGTGTAVTTGQSVTLTSDKWWISSKPNANPAGTRLFLTYVPDTDMVEYVESIAVTKGDLVLNVKDHGAAGDGTTDDTAAIRAAITAAAIDGAIVFFPRGTYKVTGELSLSQPGGYDASVLLKGEGRMTTALQWPTDLGAGFFAVKYANRGSGNGQFHRIEDMSFIGPSAAAALGAHPANMDCLGGDDRFTTARLRITGFNAGIVKVNSHQRHEDVMATENYCAVRYQNGSSGDIEYIGCDFTGNKQASVVVEQDARMSGDRFIGTHLGFSPYAILGETGGTNDFLIVDTLFVGSGFEAVGNSLIYSSAARHISGALFIRCGSSISNAYLTTTRDAVIDTAGNVSNVRTMMASTLAPVMTGMAAYVKAAALDNCLFEDAGTVVDELRAASIPFYSGAGFPSGVTVATPKTRFVVLKAEATVTTDRIVSMRANDQIRPYQAGDVPLGVAQTGATTSQAALVAVDGIANVDMEGAATNVQPLIPGSTTASKTKAGATSDSPIIGYSRADIASGANGLMRVRTQF